MKPITILKRARKLLSKPERWTKGALGKIKHGMPTTNVMMPGVCCFCAEGALRRVCGLGSPYGSTPHFEGAFDALVKTTTKRVSPSKYNDSKRLTHRNLMQWFDRAIKLAEKQQ
jgi:hypothetical protein